MTYETICRYVFACERIDWSLHDSKKRDRELVFARQVSIYLGNSFYPGMTWVALAAIFKKDHATAMHAVKSITNLMFSDSDIRQKMLKYSSEIQNHIRKRRETEIKVMLKMKNSDTLSALLTVIDKMELVAKIYCDITNNKIVKYL